MYAAVIPTDSHDEFVSAAATVLERAIVQAIDKNGRCVLGLSGGSTPGPAYDLLGRKRTIEWEKVHVFLVDERCVPMDDDRSNAKLLEETLFRNAGVPDLQRHYPDTSMPPGECARFYDHDLRQLLPDAGPDVVTLGLGDDGHVASLFPPLSPADLGAAEFAVATKTPLLPDGTPRFPVKDRISTTLTLLRTTETKVFLLNGAAKKPAWEESSRAGADALRWPGSLLVHRAVAVTKW
jgi:6-phosphogluconolactonase